MKNNQLKLEDLTMENGWRVLRDLSLTHCRVYENFIDGNQKYIYFFYGGEREGEITQTPWKKND